VKKLVLIAAAGAAGFAVWRKQSGAGKKPAQQLWSQATDRV
jgi:hypothetical protein